MFLLLLVMLKSPVCGKVLNFFSFGGKLLDGGRGHLLNKCMMYLVG